MELLAESVDTEKTEETDPQHIISENNIPNLYLLIFVKLTFFNQPDLHMNNQASNKNVLDNVTIAPLEQYNISVSTETHQQQF